MKSSPDLRSWPSWLSQANANARSTSSRSIGSMSSEECSSITANRSPSSARSPSLSFFVIASGLAASCGPAGSPTRVCPTFSSVLLLAGIALPPRAGRLRP